MRARILRMQETTVRASEMNNQEFLQYGIMEVYRRFAPDRLQKVPGLLAKYHGKEAALLSRALTFLVVEQGKQKNTIERKEKLENKSDEGNLCPSRGKRSRSRNSSSSDSGAGQTRTWKRKITNMQSTPPGDPTTRTSDSQRERARGRRTATPTQAASRSQWAADPRGDRDVRLYYASGPRALDS